MILETHSVHHNDKQGFKISNKPHFVKFDKHYSAKAAEDLNQHFVWIQYYPKNITNPNSKPSRIQDLRIAKIYRNADWIQEFGQDKYNHLDDVKHLWLCPRPLQKMHVKVSKKGAYRGIRGNQKYQEKMHYRWNWWFWKAFRADNDKKPYSREEKTIHEYNWIS